MSWKCKLVLPDKQPKEVGDMWVGKAIPIDDGSGHFWEEYSGRLSEGYVRERMTRRRPLLVMMPNREVFCIDSAVSGEWRGWTVTGQAPCITVSPSINLVGRYHGWIQNGVISADCEGRTFPPSK